MKHNTQAAPCAFCKTPAHITESESRVPERRFIIDCNNCYCCNIAWGIGRNQATAVRRWNVKQQEIAQELATQF